jgi:hypothetical protein
LKALELLRQSARLVFTVYANAEAYLHFETLPVSPLIRGG